MLRHGDGSDLRWIVILIAADVQLEKEEGARACLRQVCDAQHKADGVQDVRLATAIETSDGVEEGVKVGHVDTRCIGLEALERDLLYVHPSFLPLPGTHP